MNKISELMGQGEDLTPLQMALRAILIFIVTLILIRLGGVRIFGRRSSTDTIIVIVMGSVLARGIVGASPLLSVIAAASAMIILHRLFGWLSQKFKWFDRMIKGRKTRLYENGTILLSNLEKTALTTSDLMESLRLETKQEELEKIESAYLETNGRISFINKEEKE
jgi:uncharacterized membrane protein YcaP (DUF421 family)